MNAKLRVMDEEKKSARYKRIIAQLEELFTKTSDLTARMATVCAVLHHKMDNFFWTGFYILKEGELIVGPYQGPLACQVLSKTEGVCRAAVNSAGPIIVADVDKFIGHIACDSRSRSEIAIPLKRKTGEIIAILDIDSKELSNFDETDAEYLTRIMEDLLTLPPSLEKVKSV